MLFPFDIFYNTFLAVPIIFIETVNVKQLQADRITVKHSKPTPIYLYTHREKQRYVDNESVSLCSKK